MIAALDADNCVIGYFLGSQLNQAGILASIQNDYSCPATSFVACTDVQHAAIVPLTEQDGYYDGTDVIPRPLMATIAGGSILGDGTETHTATGLPEGAAVTVNGASAGTVSGGEFAMTAATPGTYEVIVALLPYMPRTYRVEGT